MSNIKRNSDLINVVVSRELVLEDLLADLVVNRMLTFMPYPAVLFYVDHYIYF